MRYTSVLSNAKRCFITITHNYSDPSSWIVKRWTKLMWFKKLISTDWFNDEQQALAFAAKIKCEHHGKEIIHHAE
jgi:hypothetical protein